MKGSSSINAKLKNIARQKGIPFQQIIFRYIHERLLYRISISEYAENLFLKGGNLLYAMQDATVRPTKDVDFLGLHIHNNADLIKKIFTDICSSNYDKDFVWFDIQTITAGKITEEHKYSGIRLLMDAGFDTIKQRIQIDIGFGDVMVPSAQQLVYPVLLREMERPVILAYSSETVIAEKFQAMIELAGLNSRMKDFYDIYSIIQSGILVVFIIGFVQAYNQHNKVEKEIEFAGEYRNKYNGRKNQGSNLNLKTMLNSPLCKEEGKLAVIQAEFEHLYDDKHPAKYAIETLDSIEEVRIIKDALK